MGINLQKGGNTSLSKESPGLRNILVGLSWDARSTNGLEFDLDANAFLLGESGKVRKDDDFIFFNNLKSTCGSVQLSGDNRTGAGDGDDESLNIRLDQVPADVKRIAVTVVIHEAQVRKQNFGQVNNSFIRVVNSDNNNEIVRFDLAEDYSTETAMIFGEIYRHGNEWKFKAVGQGFSGGLVDLCALYGVSIN